MKKIKVYNHMHFVYCLPDHTSTKIYETQINPIMTKKFSSTTANSDWCQLHSQCDGVQKCARHEQPVKIAPDRHRIQHQC